MGINIADLLPESRKVNIGRGEVEVNGISLGDLVPLVNRHGAALGPFLDTKQGENPDFTSLIYSAPEVVADLISIGIGAEDKSLVKRIPLASQVEILLAMWELSVPDPKALTAKLSKLLGTVQQLKS